MFILECIAQENTILSKVIYHPINWFELNVNSIIHDQLIRQKQSLLYLVMREGIYNPAETTTDKEKIFCLGRPARIDQLQRLIRDLQIKQSKEWNIVGYAIISTEFVPKIEAEEVPSRLVYRRNRSVHTTLAKAIIERSNKRGTLYASYWFRGIMIKVPEKLSQSEANWYLKALDKTYRFYGKPIAHLVFDHQPIYKRLFANLPF